MTRLYAVGQTRADSAANHHLYHVSGAGSVPHSIRIGVIGPNPRREPRLPPTGTVSVPRVRRRSLSAPRPGDHLVASDRGVVLDDAVSWSSITNETRQANACRSNPAVAGQLERSLQVQ